MANPPPPAPPPRKKSCTPCRHAKTRCSLDVPSCSRCTKRRIDCTYEFLPRVPVVSLPLAQSSLVPSPIIQPQPQSQPQELPQAHVQAQVQSPLSSNSKTVSPPPCPHPSATFSETAHDEHIPTTASRQSAGFHTWLLETRRLQGGGGSSSDGGSSGERREVNFVGDGCPLFGAMHQAGNMFALALGRGGTSRPASGGQDQDQDWDQGRQNGEQDSMDWSQDGGDSLTAAAASGRNIHQNAEGTASNSRNAANTSSNSCYSTPTQNEPIQSTSLKNRMTVPLPSLQNSKFVLAKWDTLKRIPNNTSRIMKRKPVTKMVDLLRGNHVQSTFESYICKFDRNELPPFMHPISVLKGQSGGNGRDESVELPEALVSSKTILPMYLHDSACRPLVFKTMLLEVQRIHDEFRTYNEDGLLHSLQALAIYLILLARDKEPYDLVSIVTRITISEIIVLFQGPGFKTFDTRSEIPKWEDWVREESKIRTLLIIYLMKRLVDLDVDPVKAACSGLYKVPLPSSKLLWEAETAAVWEVRYREYISHRSRESFLTIEDLQRSLDSEVADLEARFMSDLSDWSRDVDEFGGLVLNCGLLAK